MRRLKRRIFAGAVCEQIVYSVSDGVSDIRTARPKKPRFASDEERAEHRLGISRRRFARLVNANFSPSSLYVTLTLDNEDEVHTFAEAKKIRDNFVRRVQYHAPDVRLCIVMGRGKHTDRIHYHAIIEGAGEDVIRRCWNLGDVVRIVKLREHNWYDGVDHGRDYTGLANYLFDHWTPEQGGHRYKHTRNLEKPEPEPATEAIREYSETRPPVAPRGYKIVEARSTRYGLLYYKYVRIPARM